VAVRLALVCCGVDGQVARNEARQVFVLVAEAVEAVCARLPPLEGGVVAEGQQQEQQDADG
jgi:hypothetical protein